MGYLHDASIVIRPESCLKVVLNMLLQAGEVQSGLLSTRRSRSAGGMGEGDGAAWG